MSASDHRHPWREALLAATLPPIERGGLEAFWRRFEQVAPVLLRLGLRAAAVIIGLLPVALGYGRPLVSLSEDERDAVIQRASELSLLAPLLEVAKLVACLGCRRMEVDAPNRDSTSN